MPVFRSASMTQAATHPYAQYVDGIQVADVKLIGPDGLHCFNARGQQQQATRIKAVLGLH